MKDGDVTVTLTRGRWLWGWRVSVPNDSFSTYNAMHLLPRTRKGAERRARRVGLALLRLRDRDRQTVHLRLSREEVEDG